MSDEAWAVAITALSALLGGAAGSYLTVRHQTRMQRLAPRRDWILAVIPQFEEYIARESDEFSLSWQPMKAPHPELILVDPRASELVHRWANMHALTLQRELSAAMSDALLVEAPLVPIERSRYDRIRGSVLTTMSLWSKGSKRRTAPWFWISLRWHWRRFERYFPENHPVPKKRSWAKRRGAGI